MNKKLFVDTWGWLTLHDKNELQHQVTVDFYKSFRSQNGVIYTTDYVLDETFTLFFKRLYPALAKSSMELLIQAFREENFNIVWITQERFFKAQELRSMFLDKPQISLTDLTSMAVMKELGIDFVLTGDAHFTQVNMGFQKMP
jgi:predicted nucleic acid-binding protein